MFQQTLQLKLLVALPAMYNATSITPNGFELSLEEHAIIVKLEFYEHKKFLLHFISKHFCTYVRLNQNYL
jgi:hypothetical protein